MGQAPNSVTLPNGKVAHRDFMAEHSGKRRSAAQWPIECIASGVSGHQADELRAYFKKHNFDCDVSNDGNPIYRDAQHRKRALKLRGFCDKSSYGT